MGHGSLLRVLSRWSSYRLCCTEAPAPGQMILAEAVIRGPIRCQTQPVPPPVASRSPTLTRAGRDCATTQAAGVVGTSRAGPRASRTAYPHARADHSRRIRPAWCLDRKGLGRDDRGSFAALLFLALCGRLLGEGRGFPFHPSERLLGVRQPASYIANA